MTQKKSATIADFKKHETDTGSMEVQIARITERISYLTEHCKIHAKDFSTKRGLLTLVSQRRRYLRYIERHDEAKCKELKSRLGIRK